jgi:hypothetical protein
MTDIDLWLVEPARHPDHLARTGHVSGRAGRTERSTAAVLRDDSLTPRQRAALLDVEDDTPTPLPEVWAGTPPRMAPQPYAADLPLLAMHSEGQARQRSEQA